VLLHGHPRTHATWHRVAALLAPTHTVVCPDLRGYGASTVPPDRPRHAQASKRAMAGDVVRLMEALGHRRFAVAGHDRGACVAFRAAMEHRDRVVALTGMTRTVTIGDALARGGWRFARDWWHWFFLGQTEKPAEDVIAAVGPGAWYRLPPPELIGEEAHRELRSALRDPAVVHGMCEDYRAGLAVDVEHDEADRAAGRRIACPVQALWAEREDAHLFGGDPLAIWRGWAGDVRGHGIDCGHHLAEEAPEATAEALLGFWAETGWTGSA
jgi:haloacetate dehalogenase